MVCCCCRRFMGFRLDGTALNNIEIHLGWISCLQFYLNSIQLPLESILWAGINHLASDTRLFGRPNMEIKVKKLSNQLMSNLRCNQVIERLFSYEMLIIPSNEENPAFLAVFCCDKIKIINCISAFISRKTGSEVIVVLSWLANFFNNNLLLFFFYLKDNEAVSPFCLQFQEPQLAIIVHSHPRCRVCL